MKQPRHISSNADAAREQLAAMRKGAQAPTDAAPVEDTNDSKPEGTDTPAPVVVKPEATDVRTESSQPTTKAPMTSIELDDWKSRYDLLRTKRDAKLDALEQENQVLKSNLARLQEQMESLQPPVNTGFEISDNDKELLGETEAEMFARLGKHFDERFDKIEKREEVQAKSDHQLFLDDLSTVVPEWQRYNEDPAFLQWLGGQDSSSGLPNQELLNHAVSTRNVAAASKVFTRYFASTGSSNSQSTGGNDSVIDPSNSSRQMPEDTSDMVEIWDVQEVADFYEEKSKLYREGKLFGKKAEEITAIQARIDKARAEGRIQ